MRANPALNIGSGQNASPMDAIAAQPASEIDKVCITSKAFVRTGWGIHETRMSILWEAITPLAASFVGCKILLQMDSLRESAVVDPLVLTT